MLYSINNLRRPIRTIPYRQQYNTWMIQLGTVAHDAVIAELDRKIDGTEVQTSSWMPGKWENTVFMSIWEACGRDEIEAGLFFGLLVWETFMNRPEAWSFGRYNVRNVPIRGLTYFRIHI